MKSERQVAKPAKFNMACAQHLTWRFDEEEGAPETQ